MQVTQAQEHVTHALVGSKETINMGVAETAAFFTMMSSTLYSNQKLAVVREVLCNAWDAHIDSNRTHIPLQVTLTEDQLIIRDFGYGIPHNMIGPIYGVYGGSTKAQDKKSTGGFGLGSKAPFAYTEHFRVVNCHEGTRTVYQMSKSSNEVEGKPSIDTIVSTPTEDSGLTVIIDISPSDHSSFMSLVHGVIANGDMLVDVNEERAETLPFDSMKHNFLITSETPLNDNTSIKLRYGTVVYPLHNTEEISHAYSRVQEFINHLNRNVSYSYHSQKRLYLILQAEPDTITVTPSRESLSMQSKTIKTVNKLLTDFNELLVKRIEPACQPIIHEATTNLFIKNPYLVSTHRIDIKEEVYTYLQKGDNLATECNSDTYVVTVEGTAKQLAARKKLIKHKEYKALWLQRLKCLIPTLEPGMIGAAQALYSEARRIPSMDLEIQSNTQDERTSWLRKKIINPLLKEMITTNLSTKRFLVRDTEYGSWRRNYNSVRASNERTIHQDLSLTYDSSLPYLNPIVVISHNRRDREDGLREYSQLLHVKKATKNNMGLVSDLINDRRGYFLYIVERNQDAINEAKQFFKKASIKVIDITPFQQQSKPIQRISTKTTRPVSRKKGFALLSSAVQEGEFNVLYSQTDEAKRIEHPKCFVSFPIKNKDIALNKLPGISAQITEFITENYGDVTALVVTDKQREKCHEMKLPLVHSYVAIDLLQQLKANKPLLKYISNRQYIDDVENNLNINERTAFLLVVDDPYLAKTYKINTGISREEAEFLKIWQYFINYLPTEQEKEYEQLLKPSKSIDKLVSLIDDNPLIDCLCWREIRDELRSSSVTEPTKKTLYRLINSILKKGKQNDE